MLHRVVASFKTKNSLPTKQFSSQETCQTCEQTFQLHANKKKVRKQPNWSRYNSADQIFTALTMLLAVQAPVQIEHISMFQARVPKGYHSAIAQDLILYCPSQVFIPSLCQNLCVCSIVEGEVLEQTAVISKTAY